MNHWDGLIQVLEERRSIRSFRKDAISEETLSRVLRAATLAPSASNRQAFRFIVVRREALRRRMTEVVSAAVEARARTVRSDLAADLSGYLAQFLHFSGAPVVVVPLYRSAPSLLDGIAPGDPEADPMAGIRDSLASVSAAITQMLLAAHALDLGACWMTGPLIAEAALASLLKVPPGWRIAALIPLGHPSAHPSTPPRRALERLMLPEPEVYDDPSDPPCPIAPGDPRALPSD